MQILELVRGAALPLSLREPDFINFYVGVQQGLIETTGMAVVPSARATLKSSQSFTLTIDPSSAS